MNKIEHENKDNNKNYYCEQCRKNFQYTPYTFVKRSYGGLFSSSTFLKLSLCKECNNKKIEKRNFWNIISFTIIVIIVVIIILVPVLKATT